MTRQRILAFLIFLLAGQAWAQGLLPRLGEQRAGTASMTFLKIGVGARAAAMGGAYVAMANDASATYWNPAGLVQIGRNELVVSHLDWLVDVDFEYLGYVHQLTRTIGLGGFVGYLHFADMPVTTEYHPYGNGDYFSYNDLVAGVSASLKMTDRFSCGITVKYVREQLAELQMGGVLLDLGTYYWTGYKTLRIAAAMRNFGNDIGPEGTYMRRKSGGETETAWQSFSPPTLFTLGAAMDLFQRSSHLLTGSVQMNHPMDDQENLLLGCEYRYRTLFFLRGGYRANMDENRWTFGAGAKFILKGVHLKIDYAYADYTHLSMSQQFTFGFEF
ncbi:MAG TPA: PorV/PorQ family protein [bacterium]|nr:PorV/PorQ family protein [bacterium]HOC23929.1 PorV/PorQ family protein [bacterium]HOH06921.1 PorV/PorQ family protein [bacterium]HOY43613.1 PorV/PorQ family protein [bacterium]HPG81859.1 PorV/PorQ family protein [bacterium]